MIPIFVGVTGHRSICSASVSSAQKAASLELRDLQRRAPTTPLILVSALAEGADRLIAKLALECGYALWAVLPSSAAEYIKDFESQESKDEFCELLARASHTVNAALQAGRLENSTQRPEMYVDVGHQICRMSHLLIALWDGVTEEKPGGTSQVVRLFRSGVFLGANPSGIAYPDCGPVIHIAVSRDGVAPVLKGVHWLAPSPGKVHKPLLPSRVAGVRGDYDRSVASLEAFNARCAAIPANPERAARELLPPSFAWQGDTLLFRWLSWFSQAEAVSGAAAGRRRRNLMLIVLLFILFSMATLSYGGLVVEAWPLFLGLLALSASLVVYWLHRLNGTEEAWVGGRALAECLRVAIIWRGAGCDQAVHHVASQEGIFPFDWLGMAARSIDAGRCAESAPVGVAADVRASLVSFWCESQQAYFVDGANRIAHHSRLARRYGRFSAACVFMAMLAYLLSIIIDLQFLGEDRSQAMAVTVLSMYLYWSLLCVGAVVASYSQIIGHADHELDYKFALVKFRMADLLLKASPGVLQADLIVNLGRAALREVITWLRLHRGRPLRLPF